MNKKLNQLILSFGAAKLLIHFFTNTNYHFHRDEYLYLSQGNHLSWGFMEVPPLVPFIGKIANLLGGSVFATRLFPALVGAATIILAGWLVKNLGGKKWAIIFTCTALLFSPALLGSNTLFQPVSFNQFFWFLSAFFLVQAIKTEQPKFWYFLGVSIGIGVLAKYSIAFYGVSLAVALLMTPQRKWLATKYPYIALGIGLLIASPNILWQFQHNLPVLAHMRELSESQLVNVEWSGFFISQLQFHMTFSLVWIVGIIGLFRLEKLKPYRFLGIGFMLTVLLIAGLSGKSYYTIGAFTILFPFGGIALEKWVTQKTARWALVIILPLLILSSLPYVLPILKINQMKKYCAYMADNFGFDGQLRWEDGKYYDLPQDYADMHGWEELSQKVAKVYHSLTPEQKEKCIIYGGSYGHTCSLNYYRKKYNLPEVYSFSSSCLMWLPEDLEFENQIMIDEAMQTESTWFNDIVLKDSIENPFARDPGYIFYRENPKGDLSKRWKEIVVGAKEEFAL